MASLTIGGGGGQSRPVRLTEVVGQVGCPGCGLVLFVRLVDLTLGGSCAVCLTALPIPYLRDRLVLDLDHPPQVH